MSSHESSDETQSARRPDVLLEHAVAMLAPLVRVLIANGATYPQFAALLKPAFLRAAHAELTASGKRISDSAISIVSGVHRKDVRTLTADGVASPPQSTHMLSLASEVVAQWCHAPYVDAEGQPRALPLRSRNGDGSEEPLTPSFEQLTQSVTRDFHSRAVLDELVRLRVVAIEKDVAHLSPERLVADQDFIDALQHVTRNIHDHMVKIEGDLSAQQ